MKKKNPNSQNLKQLIKEWDEKLKSSGFKDIEDRKTGLLKHNGGDVTVANIGYSLAAYRSDKEPSFAVQRGYSSLAWKESQAEYYRIASQILHEAEFKTPRHRIIWQLHSEGVTQQEIAAILNITRRKVELCLKSMQIEFGLRFVQDRQK